MIPFDIFFFLQLFVRIEIVPNILFLDNMDDDVVLILAEIIPEKKLEKLMGKRYYSTLCCCL